MALWKIPHKSGIDDVRLKVGRYKKEVKATGSSFLVEEPESPEIGDPKSELTLGQEEFASLIKFLQDNYDRLRWALLCGNNNLNTGGPMLRVPMCAKRPLLPTARAA